jgi:hypothetical protein
VKVLFIITLLSLTGCSVYKSQGRECLETKSNCAAVDLPADAFSTSVAVKCNEPLDPNLDLLNMVDLANHTTTDGNEITDWYAYSQNLDLWLLQIGKDDCTYFYNDKKSLMQDYRKENQLENQLKSKQTKHRFDNQTEIL